MAEIQSELVLAQNQHAFIQDTTKGTVQVYAGPHKVSLSPTDRPVVYDRKAGAYIQVPLERAICTNPFVAEGQYLVLENPSLDKDGKINSPRQGGGVPNDLLIGRKINIPGPATFPLWPGQFADAVPGHHLRSNQYLLVRVYNADEAAKNTTDLLAGSGMPKGREVGVAAFTLGQLIVIKGTEASFFIPPTGFEVLKDDASNGAYVREALTLERLEYAILLDEDGNKRYERGPQVVFPKATETFITRSGDEGDSGRGNSENRNNRSRKFKAIELNDYMGLYIKVTADYEEDVPAGTTGAVPVDGDDTNADIERSLRTPRRYVRRYVTGEELFITGKEQRIYYQRAEHALIGYDDPSGSFKRERYYGITIPKGEGRYVLDKSVGDIKLVQGPRILLPDPRNETITRRVLDAKTVNLWYPGNAEAMAFNAQLATQVSEDMGYLTYNAVSADAASRGMNRMTAANIGGDTFKRSGKFTPPPTLTLGAATKYDGVPSINVWTGYAVQVVDRSGNRRVVVGPAAILLNYDETLEMLTLSTGKPKNTDNLLRDVYLRVDNNLVSDIITIETKDMVAVRLKVSYRVNFLSDHSDKWFKVENYVKYLCDHMRSMLKARGKKMSITELISDSATMIRDVVLGAREDRPDTAVDSTTKVQRHRFFPENGMDVYDVEVLGVEIADNTVAQLLTQAQTRAVASVITLAANEQNLEATRRMTEIDVEMLDLSAKKARHTYVTQQDTNEVQHKAAIAELAHELLIEAKRKDAEVVEQQQLNAIAEHALTRTKASSEHALSVETKRAELFKARMDAITPQLIQALQTMGDQRFMSEVTRAIAPLAIEEQQGLGQTIERVFAGTALEPILNNMKAARKQRELTSTDV